jgi:hypothetical protein
MEFNQFELYQEFISKPKKAFEKKIILDILSINTGNYIEIAEKYSEYSIKDIEAIFSKYKSMAYKKLGLRDDEKISLEKWVETIKEL